MLDIDKLLDFSGKGFKKATLILEDGMRFDGNSIGVDGLATVSYTHLTLPTI